MILVPDDGWIVTDGHLDRAKLAAKSPDAAEALQHGLTWNWVHHQAPQAFPGLKEFLRKGLRTEARLERTEDSTFKEMWACMGRWREVIGTG